MALQNFIDKAAPVISAAWLNAVDTLKETVFGAATTKALARTALTSDAPLEVANGGTGTRVADGSALTNLGATQDYLAPIITPKTTVETNLSITPTKFIYAESDIRRYGATTVAADNSTAINTALRVSNGGGNAAFVPGGTWAITNPILLTGGSSIYGVGQASIIAPNGCDGLTFDNQGTYAGTRFVRDFQINSTNGTTNNGIICDFTAASGFRITQVTFSRLTIQNFKQGVFAHGMWNCNFDDCWGYNNYQGIWMYGQNIQCTIRYGFFQRQTAGTPITGAGTQYGLNVTTDTLASSTESTQSLKVIGWGAYAWDVNVNLALSLYTMIEFCDLSVAKVTGVRIVSCAGGTTIRDCWIQTNYGLVSAATTGIELPALGSTINDPVLIDNCTIICDLANVGSIGINVGNNHNSVRIMNCTIGEVTSPWAQALVNNNCNNMVAKFNTIYASSVGISIHSSAVAVDLGPNIVLSGTQVFTGATPLNFSYYGIGTYTLNPTNLSGATATVNWVANGRRVDHTLVTGSCTGTTGGAPALITSSGDIPPIIWPVTTRGGIMRVQNGGVHVIGFWGLTNAGVLTIFADVTGANFTAASNGGLLDNWGYTYT